MGREVAAAEGDEALVRVARVDRWSRWTGTLERGLGETELAKRTGEAGPLTMDRLRIGGAGPAEVNLVEGPAGHYPQSGLSVQASRRGPAVEDRRWTVRGRPMEADQSGYRGGLVIGPSRAPPLTWLEAIVPVPQLRAPWAWGLRRW